MEAKLRQIIAEQLGINEEEVQPDSSFGRDLGADSLDWYELLMSLEEEFDVDIPSEDASTIETVQQLSEYLRGRAQ